ncbi:MAG: HD domain-containing protein [Chloroflexi bacterium]|nr:HD domain-containing protein [Chloroflexota bacterium]
MADLSTYLILPIIEISFSVALLALATFLGRRHVARKPFAFFLGFMAIWGMFVFLMRANPTLSGSFFWEKFLLAAIVSAALAFYRFTISFTGVKSKKGLLYVLYILHAAIIILIPTNLIASGMQPTWYGKAPVIGPLFPLFLLGVYVPPVLGLTHLIKHCRQSRIVDEIIRDQYIIAGIVAMLLGGTTDFLPSLGLTIYPLGIIGNILFCILTTIAMLRHGLLEIRVVLRKSATYSLTSILIFGIFGSLILTLSKMFEELLNPLSVTITITSVFFVAAIFQPLLSRLQRTVDKLFFRQRYEHLQALRQFSKETKSDLDLKQLSTSLVTTVANGMLSRGVYLLLRSPVSDSFEMYSYCGEKSRRPLSFSSISSLTVTMKYQDRIIDINDMDVIPSLSSLNENDKRALLDSNIELLVPLKHSGRLVGMLLIGSRFSREPYLNEDRQLLQSVAGNVAAKVENASRYENVKQERSELQKTMEGLIHAVSSVVEFRDPYTAGHQRRVAELAYAITKEMGLSEWHMKGIYIIGLLHDVGKVVVPAEILSKPGKINEHEFSIIKNHPKVGYEILEKMEFPWPAAKAILQHHERLNGSGYPQGLSGEDIILEAKILSVADVVEAMSSHRPYRPALGLDNALKEITEQSGTLYDTDVVAACLRLLKSKEDEFERLMTAAANRDNTAVSVEK